MKIEDSGPTREQLILLVEFIQKDSQIILDNFPVSESDSYNGRMYHSTVYKHLLMCNAMLAESRREREVDTK